MEAAQIERISIPGPTLALIIHRFITSPADCDGLLFGHLRTVSPHNLTDDDDSLLPQHHPPHLVATVTSGICSGIIQSFYNANGQIDAAKLSRFLNQDHRDPLIGWFVARRNTPLRPSMREAAVAASLRSSLSNPKSPISNRRVSVSSPRVSNSKSRDTGLGLPYSVSSSENSGIGNANVVSEDDEDFMALPYLFMLFSASISQHGIHSHDYRGFQYCRGRFEPRSIEVVNLGPGFRSNYGLFSPVSGFPKVDVGGNGNGLREDGADSKGCDTKGQDASVAVSLLDEKQRKSQMDRFCSNVSPERMEKLVWADASNHVSEVEGLYHGMLAKLEQLAQQVRESSAAVAQQEWRNMELRSKAAGVAPPSQCSGQKI